MRCEPLRACCNELMPAYDTARGQCMIMLVVALSELRVTVSKQEAIAHIASKHWFDVQLPDDNLPYPSAIYREPRWHCLIAWSRKDAVIREGLSSFRGVLSGGF